jgi:glycosyltransferase involved in cell wall biosynthesis
MKDFHIFLPWVNFSGFQAINSLPSESASIMFFGAMWRRVNEDAVLYFVKSIFPIILDKIPNAIFYVVGSKPSRQIRNLGSKNIIVTGFVESVNMYYNKCAVVVVPLRAGSGIKGKVIQALGFGRPVVSTSVGAEGILLNDANGLFIEDEPPKFAQKVVALMESSTAPFFERRDLVLKEFEWSTNFQSTYKFIQELTQTQANDN